MEGLFEKKDSAEQRFLVEKYDPEMRAAKFVADPQEYINQHHDYLQENHHDETNRVALAVQEIYELEKIILESNFTELNSEIEEFITLDEYDPRGFTVLLTWLKEAGYSKTQVRTWIDIEQDNLSPAEQLQDRSLRVVYNKVFAE